MTYPPPPSPGQQPGGPDPYSQPGGYDPYGQQPPGGNDPYSQPQYGQPPSMSPYQGQPAMGPGYQGHPNLVPKNGLCRTGLVLGIASVALFVLPFLLQDLAVLMLISPVAAIAAIVFSSIGLSQTKNGKADAKGAAIAGLVLGIVALVAAICLFSLAVFIIESLRSAY
ncbi:DUF4190 domain-containing protein [Natronoglycomyces albus]|uniref:DUF4190 domain-containing protein n=1 Tax=Natronoglycomyces albus TaxID=2811108 RepID=A0A895XR59_9ACTN|nr:DUF4190 domain-containing protein [Natronoglycomyces albus]QSB06202.1 hypothetical protein JQS30_04635 [Natronoglycomyces albus]